MIKALPCLRRSWIGCAAVLLFPSPGGAQQTPTDPVPDPVTLAEGVFLLRGLGCNVMAVQGTDGLLLVDNGSAQRAGRLEAELAKLGTGPVSIAIDTHFHFDHVGANEHLSAQGAVIVGHEATRARMEEEWRVPERFGIRHPVISPYPEAALPRMTFSKELRLPFGAEEVHLIHFGRGHSDSDVAVFLPDRNILHTGDLYLSNGFPVIDVFYGGSVAGTLAALDSLISLIDGDTKVVPGHGPISDREGLRRYRAMLGDATDRILALAAEGKTLDEIVQADPVSDLYPGESWLSPTLFVWPAYVDAMGDKRPATAASQPGHIPLPQPSTTGGTPVRDAIATRRSERTLAGDPLGLSDLSQILWAAQGVTEVIPEAPAFFGNYDWGGGLRTTPSAGALYPLEVYAVVSSVEGLDPGVYRYIPIENALVKELDGDVREALWDPALRNTAVRTAPVTLVLAAVVERTRVKYRERAERFVHIEVGAAAENVYLQAGSLGLGTVFAGAFRDEAVKSVLGLPEDQDVFGIMPVGMVPRG